MNIQFQGAARTVTGSMHMVTVGGKTILLDCGIYHGHRDEARKRNSRFPFDPASISAVVLSHAHIDHSGNLPGLVKQGFRGPIYATHATQSLCAVMLKDSAFIQEKDAEFVNKRNQKKGLPLVTPLYTEDDVEQTIPLFQGVDYSRTFSAGEGINCRLEDAGHILRSHSARTLQCADSSLRVTWGGRTFRS
jgi:metallo-beta-lactamase family protein